VQRQERAAAYHVPILELAPVLGSDGLHLVHSLHHPNDVHLTAHLHAGQVRQSHEVERHLADAVVLSSRPHVRLHAEVELVVVGDGGKLLVGNLHAPPAEEVDLILL
jgi:hypothetical protein